MSQKFQKVLNRYIDGFNSSIFLAVPMKTIGTFGVGFTLYDLGSVDINYYDGTSESVHAMQSWTVNLGYGVNVIDEFSLGMNLKYIKSTLADKYTGTAFAADCGLLYRTLNSDFSYGFALQNIGTNLIYISDGDPLPFTIRTGVAYKFREAAIDSWLATADLVYYDSKLRYNAGIECNLFKVLSVRAGYKLGYTPDTLSFGAGFNVSRISLDYAYSMLGSIDNVQMFTLSYRFGEQTDYDIAKVYLDKGMNERALALFKTISKDNSNYNSALIFIAAIEKYKEDRKQYEFNAIIEAEKQQKLKEEQQRQAILKETGKWSGKRIKIAVMNLEPNNLSNQTAALISDVLRNVLFDFGKYSVIERSSIDKILNEQKFQMTGCTSTECAVEVGKILSVQQTVIGTIGKIGDKFVINVRLVDVESAELIATASEECYKESDLTDICKSIARKLSQK